MTDSKTITIGDASLSPEAVDLIEALQANNNEYLNDWFDTMDKAISMIADSNSDDEENGRLQVIKALVNYKSELKLFKR